MALWGLDRFSRPRAPTLDAIAEAEADKIEADAIRNAARREAARKYGHYSYRD